MPKISIIVPVYKAEAYLHRCIDSILAQTFTDWECILVDDGSPDGSGSICDEYAAKDTRIHVIHKKNGGVSSARNAGLGIAIGTWVSFVDADDEITERYLEIDRELEDADVIIKSYSIVHINGKVTYHNNKRQFIKDREGLFFYYVRKRNNALWDKIIKKKLVETISFDTNVSIGEDFLFFLSLLPNVKSLAFDEIGSYKYFERESSAMQNIDVCRRISILWENIRHVENIMSSKNLRFLQLSIIYKSYALFLCKLRKHLTPNDTTRLKSLLKKMDIRDLKYVDLKTKIKLTIYKSLL